MPSTYPKNFKPCKCSDVKFSMKSKQFTGSNTCCLSSYVILVKGKPHKTKISNTSEMLNIYDIKSLNSTYRAINFIMDIAQAWTIPTFSQGTLEHRSSNDAESNP